MISGARLHGHSGLWRIVDMSETGNKDHVDAYAENEDNNITVQRMDPCMQPGTETKMLIRLTSLWRYLHVADSWESPEANCLVEHQWTEVWKNLVHEGDASHDQTDWEARHRGLRLVTMQNPGMYKQIFNQKLEASHTYQIKKSADERFSWMITPTRI